MRQDDKKGKTGRKARQTSDLLQSEPSMSAPSPMPGKPATSYVKPQSAQSQSPQAEWQYAQNGYSNVQQGWSASQPVQQYQSYPLQQGYQPTPSQGIPGGQLPPQQYGWQQSYTPAPQQSGWQQPYQPPTGRGWTQPYPVQQPMQQPVQQPVQNNWQGGYAVGQWADSGYAPVYGQTPAQGGNTGGQNPPGGRPPLNQSGIIKLVAAAVVVLIAVIFVVSLVNHQNQTQERYAEVQAYNDRYCQGVYVDGIHLGGMTREEARAAVQKSAQLKCDEWNVSLQTTAGEYVGEINSYHLGMTVHVDTALEEAWQQGHTGATVNERKEAMDALLDSPYHTSTALPSGDTDAIDRILSEFAASVYVPAMDAYIATFTPYATNPFEIVEGTTGRYLDVESIKDQVYDMVSRMESGVITLEPTTLYPAITKADLEKQTTLIGSHYTAISTTSTEERDANIERACDLISGTIIAPGNTFSFNEIVGPRTKKNGFHLATVYNYGKEEPGYGGGVCQVSSTIYVAAVRANLEIVKRSQHGLKVNYTDYGLDATVNYDGKKIDFAFRNNTQGNIYVVTKVMKKPKVDKNHYLVICDIYGPALETGVTYDLVATVMEVPIPEATVVPDKKATHVVYADETYTEPGKIGYEVDSYKVKYVNGEKVQETHMYHDTYAAVQPITYVGVSERPITTEEPIY